MIYIESKKKALKNIEKAYPNALIIDVTSKGEEPWVKVSPFYPHGDIPVPLSPGYFADSVEGIWQGLKVFENEGIDVSKFCIKNMKGIKRTIRKFGKPLGHQSGVEGLELFDYIKARYKIYLKAYGWMLDNKAQDVIKKLEFEARKRDLVLLDFDTNGDLDDPRKPLSHAALVKMYLVKKYPDLNEITFVNEPSVVYEKSISVRIPRAKTTTSKKKDKNPVKNKISKNNLDGTQLSLL